MGHARRLADQQRKSPLTCINGLFKQLAEWTGLEPATPGVTGRYSNQLNYHSAVARLLPDCSGQVPQTWRPYGDSNPGTHRERVMS